MLCSKKRYEEEEVNRKRLAGTRCAIRVVAEVMTAPGGEREAGGGMGEEYRRPPSSSAERSGGGNGGGRAGGSSARRRWWSNLLYRDGRMGDGRSAGP